MSALKRFLRTRAAQIAVVCIGFPAAVSTVRAVSSSYDYYVDWTTGLFPAHWAVLGFPILVACMIILPYSVFKSQPGIKAHPWRRIDLSFWIVVAFCFVLLCASIVAHGGTSILLFVSAAVYGAVMATIAEIAARMRDKQVESTLYWLQFFRQHTLRQPVGLAVALLLSGHLIIILLLFPDYLMREPVGAGGALFYASLFSLGVLTYLATFILSLSSRYEEANAEKIRAEQFKVELITNVSHDIRTPLTSIINYVDLLKGLPLRNAKFKEYTGVLESKSARLNTLIGDLMEATKASTGNTNVDMQAVDLIEIVGQVAGEFDDLFAEKELTLVVRQPEEAVIVQVDSRHLWRVLENLFSNVVKYTQPGTRVFVEIIPTDESVTFLMKNTSHNPIDFSSEMLTEQFIRGDKARQTEGSGLGLYIAKSLIELMGGTFLIRANGDLFEVEIAFAHMPVVEKPAPEDSPEESAATQRTLSWRSIIAFGVLIVVALFGLVMVDNITTRARRIEVYSPSYDYEPYYDSYDPSYDSDVYQEEHDAYRERDQYEEDDISGEHQEDDPSRELDTSSGENGTDTPGNDTSNP